MRFSGNQGACRSVLPLKALGETPSWLLSASGGCRAAEVQSLPLSLHAFPSSSLCLSSVCVSFIKTPAIGFRVHPDNPDDPILRSQLQLQSPPFKIRSPPQIPGADTWTYHLGDRHSIHYSYIQELDHISKYFKDNRSLVFPNGEQYEKIFRIVDLENRLVVAKGEGERVGGTGSMG